MIVCPFGFDVDRRRPTYPLNRSAKPDVLQSCAKSRAQTRTLAKRDSMCSEIPSELFHPKGNSVAVVMPLTKVDGDTERKRQRRAASPSERGCRSERAPWSKARDANRKRQERAPPPPLSVCNNFAAIPLPALIDEMKPTWAELSVTALAQAACRCEVNGRERKKALPCSLVFKAKGESPAVTCLPRPLQDSDYFVVFAELTDDEAAL